MTDGKAESLLSRKSTHRPCARVCMLAEAYPVNDNPIPITTIFPILKSLPKQLTDIQLNDFLFRGTVGPGSDIKLLIRGDANLFGLRVILEAKVGSGKKLVLDSGTDAAPELDKLLDGQRWAEEHA